MIDIALLVALALVVVWLWLLTRTAIKLRGEISDAESRLARRFYTLQGRVSEIGSTVSELDFEARRARGEIRFRGDMRLGEAFAVHPRVREIFAAFGISGSGCAGGTLDESRTISEACGDHSLDPRDVLAALARFVEDPSGPLEARPETARLHRIRGIAEPK